MRERRAPTDEEWAVAIKVRKRKVMSDACKRWEAANPDRVKTLQLRARRKSGQKPMKDNIKCSAFLGVHVAEQVISKMFTDVKKMPYGNQGYDFICNNDKKIDVKGSCLRAYGGWDFHLQKNTTADYFLCIAFDNRKDLNISHAWMFPGAKFGRYTGISSTQSKIGKWAKYEIDISKMVSCCDKIKRG